MVRLRSWKAFDLAPVNGDRETRQGCGQQGQVLVGVWALPEGSEGFPSVREARGLVGLEG